MILLIVKGAGCLLVLYILFASAASIMPWLPSVKGRRDSDAHSSAALSFTADASGPDSVLLIEQPQDAYATRIAMLRGAQKKLDIIYYAIQADASGKAFLGEVVRAAERGVQVRVLLDGTINATGDIKALLGALQTHPRIACSLYNPIHFLRPWRWHALLHNKLILADDACLLCGGRNVGDRFFALHGYTDTITYDRDVFVARTGKDGGVLPDAARYINRLCNHKACRPHKTKKRPEALLDTLRAYAQKMEDYNPACYARTLDSYIQMASPARKVTLITNPIHTQKKTPLIGKALHALANQAEHSVIIQTPYSTGNRIILNALSGIDANAETILLTNSVASTPNVFAFSDYYRARVSFLKTGVDIYELQSQDSMHGKSMVVDNHLSIIGSLNLDDRSLFIDTENMLVIDSEPFAQALRRSMEVFKSSSLQVGPKGTYLPGNASALPVPKLKKASMRIVPMLLRPFRFLL